ncbi:MAG: dihydroneopterin aldolase [Bacteroidetes bacterium]|nr:dihydroneopterin aldolase [Bacteroidota bacterium]
MHTVTIEGIKLFAYHGCLEEEGKVGRHYIVDVHVETDFTEAAENDDLSKTIDYVTINTIVKEEMAIPSKLIESVAARIIKRIRQEFNTVYGTKVCIKKLSPPVPGDVEWVSVIISE